MATREGLFDDEFAGSAACSDVQEAHSDRWEISCGGRLGDCGDPTKFLNCGLPDLPACYCDGLCCFATYMGILVYSVHAGSPLVESRGSEAVPYSHRSPENR